jgi:hypothetical protein
MASRDTHPMDVDDESMAVPDGLSSSSIIPPCRLLEGDPQEANRKSGVSASEAIELSSDGEDVEDVDDDDNKNSKSNNHDYFKKEIVKSSEKGTAATHHPDSVPAVGEDYHCCSDGDSCFDGEKRDGGLRTGSINAINAALHSKVTPSTKRICISKDPFLGVGEGGRGVAAMATSPIRRSSIDVVGGERESGTPNGDDHVTDAHFCTSTNRDSKGGYKRMALEDRSRKRERNDDPRNSASAVMQDDEEDDNNKTPSTEPYEGYDASRGRKLAAVISGDGRALRLARPGSCVMAENSSCAAYRHDKGGYQNGGGDEARTMNDSPRGPLTATGWTLAHPVVLGAASRFWNPNNVAKVNNKVEERCSSSIRMKCMLPLEGNGGFEWKTLNANDACPLCRYSIVSRRLGCGIFFTQRNGCSHDGVDLIPNFSLIFPCDCPSFIYV